MAIAFVQGTNGGVQSGPSAGVAYTSNNTTGNLLVLVCRSTGASSTAGITITDSQGNTWSVPIKTTWTGTNTLIMAYAPNCKSGANTVTVSHTGTSFLQTKLAEYSGVATSSPLDKSGDATNTSTTPTSSSVTTTQNGELIVGGFANANANNLTITAGSGYTKRTATDDGNGAIEDQVQTSAGAISANFTSNQNVSWDAGIMTFFAAAVSTNKNLLMMMGCGT
jgi:hypothetical protein